MEAAAKNDNTASATATDTTSCENKYPSSRPLTGSSARAELWRSFGHFIGQVMDRVKQYDTFTADNDPWKEHDFGAFEFEGEKIFWKIDDYQGEEGLQLVLTIMLAEEY